MSEAVVLVGTKKGLWVGRSDEGRQDWEWSEPQFLMEAVYGTCIDTRGSRTEAFGRWHQRALGSGRLLLRRPRTSLDRGSRRPRYGFPKSSAAASSGSGRSSRVVQTILM